MSTDEKQQKDITFEKMEKYKEQRRCPFCKQRTFQEMVTCTRCEEYSYCCEECLQKDRETHATICTVVGLRKGLLRCVSEEEEKFEQGVIQQAKLLDVDGNFKELETDPPGKEPEPVSGRTGTKHEADQRDGKKMTVKSTRKNENVKTHSNKKGTSKKKSALDNGHFGHPLNCASEKEKSGNTFGDGWWKSKEKENKKELGDNLAAKNKPEGNGNRVGAPQTVAVGATADKQTAGATPDGAEADPESGDQCAGATSGGEGVGKEMVPYNEDNASDDVEDRPKILEKCFYCKKESYTMLKCSRCRAGRYCNKECQKKHFPDHKKGCARAARFISAVKKIPMSMLFQSMMGVGIPEISTSLTSLDSEFLHMLVGPRYSVLVEIVEPYFHPFRYGVVVMDKDGRKTHIMFYNEVNIYYDRTSWLPLPIPLVQCLRPGNFVLLIDAHWHYFFDGTVGIRIDDLDSVYFIRNK